MMRIFKNKDLTPKTFSMAFLVMVVAALILAGICMAIPHQALAAVVYDNHTTNTSSADRSSASFSYTTSGTDRLLIVVLGGVYSSFRTVTSLTYNGVDLTQAVARNHDVGTPKMITEIWYLVNPALGSNTLSITYSGVLRYDCITAISFTGVDQASPIGATAANDAASGTDFTVDITTTAVNSLIVGGVHGNGGDTDPFSPGSGTAERWDLATGTAAQLDGGFAGGEESAPTTGLYTFNFSSSVSDHWTAVAVEVKEAPAAGATPGDYLIRRNDLDSTTTVTTANLDALWDLQVASKGSSVTYSAGTFALAAGKYLVMWSERFDTSDISNNQRVEIQGRLVISGTASSIGAGQTYIRKEDASAGDWQRAAVISGAGIVDIASGGTSLVTRFYRTDTSSDAGGAVVRTPDWGGVTILALDDTWNYARYSLNAATATVDTFADVVWSFTDEQETGFSRSGADITLTNAGRYLVTYTIPITTNAGTDRTEYVSRMRLNNTTEIEGSRVSTYMRQNQSTDDGVLSYIGIIDVGAGDVLSVEMDATDGTIAGDNMENGSGIQILQLPAGNETIIVESTTAVGAMNPLTLTEFAWDSTPYIDTGAFTDTSPTDSFIEVDLADDYLFFATHATDAGAVRTFSTGRFTVNDTLSSHAAGGQYNRSSGADDAGYSFGSLLTGLSAGDDISLENIYIEVDHLDQDLHHGAMSGLRLGSIFGGTFGFRKSITIPAANLGGNCSADLDDFPLLISITDTDLRDKARSDGYDIVFRWDDGTCGGSPCQGLYHEIEKWNSSTGELIAWVRIPTLSESSDTTIYMYYGNPSVSLSSEDPTGVWSNGYEAVYHLHDDFNDSLGTRNGTNSGSTNAGGQIADGQDFDPNDGVDEVDIGNWSVSGNQLTIQAWIKSDDTFLQNDPRAISKATGVNEQDHVWMMSLYNGTANENRLRFRLKTGTDDLTGTTTLVGSSPNGYLPDANAWYLVAMTYDGANMRIIRDGLDAGSVAKTGNLRENAWSIGIGNNPGSGDTATYSWDGKIDEVRISSIVRDFCWIETEFNNQNNPGDIGSPGFYTIGGEEGGPATAVDLVSFTAKGESSSVLVEWETAQELKNMGFNLYRGTSPGGPFTKVNNKLIPGLTFSVKGKAYSYVDSNVTPGKLYYYKLEDLDVHGKKTGHGPICVDWDGDGMADDWEIAHGLNPRSDDSMLDLDGDGLTNLEEYELGTDPLNPDTDGDGIPDGEESRKRDPEEITVGRTLTQGVQIIGSDAEGITLELRTDSFDFTIVEAEGQEYERLRITEYIHGFTHEVGKPELPMKGILLDIPEEKSATLTVLETDDQIHSGYRVYPVPEKAVDDQAQLSHVGEVFVIDAAAYSQDGFYPEVVAGLGETYVFRGQQKQQVLFSPLTFNPATGEIRHHRSIRVRLSYVAGELAKAAGPEPTAWSPSVGDDGSAAFSAMVKMAFLAPSIIVNPIASVISSAAILARALWAPPSAAEPAYKILVVEEGIYRLTRSWLEANGVDVAGIDLSQVRFYNLGEEIAIRVEDGGVAGQFDFGDSIEFYATPVESQYGKYASNNVYWLTSSGGSGTPKRMAPVDATPGSATVAGTHSFTVHHEQDLWYLLSVPGGDSLDRWFFYPFVDGAGIEDGGAPVDFTLTLPGVSGQGSVKISMVGFYDTDHAVDVSVNGTFVESFTWSGISFYLATIDGVDLLEGNNTISLTCTSGVDSIAADWFEVTYPRSFAASNETLKFSHQEGYRYQVTGFSDNDLGVFDITSAAEVERLINFPVSGSGSYSLEFEPIASGERSYLALSASAVKTPVSITQDSSSSLADPANGADYILITHRDLGWDDVSGDPRGWLNDLAAFRQAQGLRVKIVDVEDIFDEFSYGIFTPQAVKDFLTHAYENWSRPAVQYVLFVGDSTYDPKGNYSWMMGADPTSTYLPTYLATTTYMGETITDEWFARVSGDDAVPDLYIGRLPAASEPEAAVMVNKIITYENGLNSKGWERNVLLVADNRLDDYEAVFKQMNEDAASLLPAGMNAPFRGYLGDYLVAGDLTAEIKGKIDEGTLMVNYSGHGSTQVWANEGIFEHGDPAFYRQDVDDLGNGDKLPFLVGMSCLTGYFGYPESWSFPSLAETMLRSEDKGAVAAFMPTGMTPTEGQHVLNTALFEAIFNDDIRTLGPAISAAKQTLLVNGKSDYEEVSETFLLFGDPAMSLKVPLPTRPEGVVIEGDTSSVTLSWQEATDCDGNPVAGYNVYRSTSPGGSYEKVNDSLISGTQYSHTPSLIAAAAHSGLSAASQTSEYYVVTSVDSDGDESVYSEEKSVTAGGGSSSGGGGGGCFIDTSEGK